MLLLHPWCAAGVEWPPGICHCSGLESLTRGKQIVFVANDLQYHWIIVLDFDVSVQPPGMLLLHPWCAAGVELASWHG